MSSTELATLELYAAGRYEECLARLSDRTAIGWTDAACMAGALAATGEVEAARELSRSFLRRRPVPDPWHGLYALVTLGEQWLHPGAHGGLELPGGHNNMLEMIGGHIPIKLLWLEQLEGFQPRASCTILNLISDPDQHAEGLKAASELERAPDIRLINKPSACLRNDRQSVSRASIGHPRLLVPETMRLPAGDAGAAALERIGVPAILRPAGSHTGRGAHLVRDEQELASALHACGEDCYLTRYVDFRREPMHFVKLRAYAIGGETLIEHVYVSDDWLVHARSALSKPDARLQELAQLYFLKMQDKIAVIADIMKRLRDSLGLDIFIADLGLMPDGRFVLFEANAVFSAILPSERHEPPYARAAAAQIGSQLVAYLGGSRARQRC